jgi:hypothetical protein
VVVATVHVLKGNRAGIILDGRPVETITSFLMPFGPNSRPHTLTRNTGVVFSGVNPNGAGFVFSPREKEQMIGRCAESEPFFHPYLSSDDLNGDPSVSPTRFIVDVGHLPEHELEKIEPLYAHLKETVGVERQKSAERRLRDEWWKFSRPAQGLNIRIGNFDRVLAMGRLATHHTFGFQGNQTIFSDALSIFLKNTYYDFALLQSRVHEVWAKFLGSSFKDDPRYIPEDCYETFPFPNAETTAECEERGIDYYNRRGALMIARNEGMTRTYNRFHDVNENAADIRELRRLHADMDCAVLRAYCWDDLADSAKAAFLNDDTEDEHFYQGRLFWPSEFRDEVLARLLVLNAERHSEEVHLGLVEADASPILIDHDEGDEE